MLHTDLLTVIECTAVDQRGQRSMGVDYVGKTWTEAKRMLEIEGYRSVSGCNLGDGRVTFLYMDDHGRTKDIRLIDNRPKKGTITETGIAADYAI